MKTQNHLDGDRAGHTDANAASFMITNLFDRQKEIRDSYQMQADPFVLLKEVTEMSRLYNESKQDSMEQQYNRA